MKFVVILLLCGSASAAQFQSSLRGNATQNAPAAYDPVRALCMMGKDTQGQPNIAPWCASWVGCIQSKAAPKEDAAAVKKAWGPAECKEVCGVWPMSPSKLAAAAEAAAATKAASAAAAAVQAQAAKLAQAAKAKALKSKADAAKAKKEAAKAAKDRAEAKAKALAAKEAAAKAKAAAEKAKKALAAATKSKKEAAAKAAKEAAAAAAKAAKEAAAAKAAAKAAKDAKDAAAAAAKAAKDKAARRKAAQDKAAAEKAAQDARAAAAAAAAAAAKAKNAMNGPCAKKLSGLPCGQEWAFVTDSKNNLLAIKKGPKTGSGKTEVHRMSAASDYKKFDLQTGTALHLTDKNWDFVMDSKDNLVAILKGPKTGSGKTEVHRLSAASNYKKFDMQTGTGLGYCDENWAFTMDSKDNLVCVKKKGATNTEVHRLTGSSNYKNFDLHTKTGLHFTYASAGQGDWDFQMDPQDNLVCILKGPSTGSKKTEVHKLSASSNFGKFVLHTGTTLAYSTAGWAFAMVKNDLVAIKKGPTTGSCMTEVHKMSGSSNYGTYTLQTGTALDLSGATSCASSFLQDEVRAPALSFLKLSNGGKPSDCEKSCTAFQASLSTCVATVVFDSGKLSPAAPISKQKQAAICSQDDSPCLPDLAIRHQKCLGHRTKNVLDTSYKVPSEVAQDCKLIADNMDDCKDCPQLQDDYSSHYAAFVGGCMDQLHSYWTSTNAQQAGYAALPAEKGECKVHPS